MRILAVLLITASASFGEATNPPPLPGKLAADVSPAAILATMKTVADWQLNHASPSLANSQENIWTYGAFYAGVMALAEIADTPKYHDAMVAMGQKFNWQPAPRTYHADDLCVCQTYLELYLKDRDPAMLRPTKERFDFILTHPSTNDLHFRVRGAADRWSWCDALFMAPPAWARLYQATRVGSYLAFLNKEWWATSDFLYDPREHLFFRDSTYFDRQEANGKKVFWSRGNGWVFAGLARVMAALPADFPHRNLYEKQFKEMAARIAALQQPDGLWHPSLLDPASYPLKETSGSGFFTFGLAWGINHGLLERGKFEPVVRKSWAALVACVTPEGRLEYVQPVGSDPKKFAPGSTEVYGTGAFLLAGRELFRLATPPAPAAH